MAQGESAYPTCDPRSYIHGTKKMQDKTERKQKRRKGKLTATTAVNHLVSLAALAQQGFRAHCGGDSHCTLQAGATARDFLLSS